MSTRAQAGIKLAASGEGSRLPTGFGLLQRKCACGGTPGSTGECKACRQKKLQRAPRHPSSFNPHPSDVPPIVHDVLSRPGRPLDAATRAFMEPRFGHDFSRVRTHANAYSNGALAIVPAMDPSEHEADHVARRVVSSPAISQKNASAYDFSGVRVHTDSAAAESARVLNARAYNVGNDIVFAEGQYRAGTATGLELIAHELVHVAQHRSNPLPEIKNALHRKAFEANEGACTATLKYFVRLKFENQGLDSWDPPQNPDYLQRQSYFRNNFKKLTEDSFNENAFCIKPNGKLKPDLNKEKSCPCPDKGFRPKLQINLLKDGEASIYKTDWTLEVAANLPRKFLTSSTTPASGTSKLDEADLTLSTKGSEAKSKQIPAVHEVGHLLGLEHPGFGIGANKPNDRQAYKHTGTDFEGRKVHGPTDLMGQGMGLRSFYFDDWRDELNKKYKKCGWQVVESKDALKKPDGR